MFRSSSRNTSPTTKTTTLKVRTLLNITTVFALFYMISSKDLRLEDAILALLRELNGILRFVSYLVILCRNSSSSRGTRTTSSRRTAT